MVFSFSIHIRDRRGRAVPVFHRIFIDLDERTAADVDGMEDVGDDFVSASMVSTSIISTSIVSSSWGPGHFLDTMMSEDISDTQSIRSLESDLMSTVSTQQMTSEAGVNLPSTVSRFITPIRSPTLLSIIDEVQSQCNFSLTVNQRRPKKVAGQTPSAPSLQQAVSASEAASIAAAESLEFGVSSTNLQTPSGREESMRALWLYGYNLCFLLVCDDDENPLAAKAALKLITQKCQEHLRLFNKPLAAVYRVECLHFIVKSILGDGVLRFLNTKALKMLEKEIEKGIRQFPKP